MYSAGRSSLMFCVSNSPQGPLRVNILLSCSSGSGMSFLANEYGLALASKSCWKPARAGHQNEAEEDQTGQAEPEGIYRLGFIVLFYSGHICWKNERPSYRSNGIRQDVIRPN